MVARFVVDLEPAISPVRLGAYRSSGSDDMSMLVNYFFNIELSEALYPALQSFQIALRNSVHTVLSEYFESDQWFDRPGLLLSWQSAAVSSARSELTRHRKSHDPGRIVAELSFGFWHSMFNRPFEDALWHANRSYLLALAFPHVPRYARKRQAIWNRIDEIRRLRNRVFHYEPIWARPNLSHEHAQVIEAIG